jgi:hypothetical protein
MNSLRMRKFLKEVGNTMPFVEIMKIWKFQDYMRFVENPKASRRKRIKATKVKNNAKS